MKKMKAALYVRVSTHHQIDKDSLPFQRKELINYCKYALNIDDYVIFEDAGYSGKDTIRPGYQDMMKRVKEGEFTHIFVWKIDRISRNLTDFTEMYDGLKDYGVTFVSKNEQFDTSSAMGEAMLKIILVFAELERKLTAERVKSIMLSRAEKGLWNGAAVPLGYDFDIDNQVPTVNEEESKTVQFIFDTYEKKQSTTEVKHTLEQLNIRTKKNRTWTTKTLADVIRNPFYIGTYRYNYRYTSGGKKRPEQEWVVTENNHPAIISRNQYDKCNAIMDSNAVRRGSDKTRRKYIHVFSRLVSCTECNKNYIAGIDRARRDGYKPSTYKCFNNAHSKLEHGKCKGFIGEVKLGPFIINYISNLVECQKSVSKNKDIDQKELEKILLTGSMFENIVGLTEDSLSETYETLLRDAGHIMIESTNDEKNVEVDYRINKLRDEKINLERALERLENLYLFDDHSMSEKNYLIKRKSISDKLKTINSEIETDIKDRNVGLQDYDLGFIGRATQYLMSENMNKDNEIDYNDMIRVVDKNLMQQFMNSVIKKINLQPDNNIESIEFVNGLKHVFVHRD